jgi:anti-sigma factor RsiW
MNARQSHDHDPEKCRQYLASLSDYVDGVLGEELCREIEAHMAECENCRVVVNTLSKTILLYRQLPAPEMPNAVKERLFKVLNLEDFQSAPKNQPGT